MKFLLSSAAIAAFILPGAAFAQSADATDGDELIVTGTRGSEPIRADRIGGSVTVIDDQAMEERQVREVADVLRDVPGVAVSGIAGQTQIRIRGAEANHTLVLIDGIEASDPYAGEFDFSSLQADEGARIEVLRGQQSALYGSDAIAGVVNYITLTGSEAPGLRARAEGGSFGTFNAAARYGGVIGDLDYAISGTHMQTDGQPGTVGGTRDLGKTSNNATVKLVYSPAPEFHLTAVGRYTRYVSDFNNQDFTTGSPTFGYAVDSPGSFVKNRGLYGLLRGDVSLLDGHWTHSVSVQYADTKRDGFDFDAPSYGDRGTRFKASYVTTVQADTGNIHHSLTGALDYEDEHYRNADPYGYAFTGWRHADTIGLVAQYDLTAGALALGAAVRHDANSLFDDATTWRVQGSYSLPFGLRIRGAAGSGVKNPGFYELFGYVDGKYTGNPNLKPERSEGWEAGLEQSFLRNQVTIGATYFDSTLKDEIYTTYPAPLYVATPDNRSTDSKQHGVETFVRARIAGGFRIDAAYTHLTARENGVKEVRRPDDIASLALAWRAPQDRGGVAVVVRYTGDQTDFAYLGSFSPTTVTLDSYTLVGVNADWAVWKGIGVFGRVENAFDQKYQQVFSFTNPGIAAYGGLKARF